VYQDSKSVKGQVNGNDRYPFYIRFMVDDRPGAIASLTEILARHDIDIDSVLQEARTNGSRSSLAITVEPTPYSKLQRALADLNKPDFNREPPLALPILRS
jgi:homoserine dehydrogenase